MARKKLPWFRFYAETVSDRKIRRLKVEHRWLWVVVLCAARQSPIEGYLVLSERESIDATDLADLGALPERTVTSGLEALNDAGLIEWDANLGAWMVPKWSERQFKSDTSTDRVRAHRERSKGDDGNGDGTLQGRSGSGGGNAPETETETETDVTPPTPPRSARGAPADLSERRSEKQQQPWFGEEPAAQGWGDTAVAQLHSSLASFPGATT